MQEVQDVCIRQCFTRQSVFVHSPKFFLPTAYFNSQFATKVFHHQRFPLYGMTSSKFLGKLNSSSLASLKISQNIPTYTTDVANTTSY